MVTVLGWGSQCINTGGEKVYPEEVEQALKAQPDVYDALVAGVPDAHWGNHVAAVVQLRRARSAHRRPASSATAAPAWPATRCHGDCRKSLSVEIRLGLGQSMPSTMRKSRSTPSERAASASW